MVMVWGYSFVACLSHLIIGHAALSRLSEKEGRGRLRGDSVVVVVAAVLGAGGSAAYHTCDKVMHPLLKREFREAFLSKNIP